MTKEEVAPRPFWLTQPPPNPCLLSPSQFADYLRRQEEQVLLDQVGHLLDGISGYVQQAPGERQGIGHWYQDHDFFS
jgi:hypothetical protein